MAELENVIRELEKEVAEGSVPCKPKGYMFPFKLIEDALSLLKAQGSRVMTLQEVHEMGWDYCYLEEEVIKDKVLQIYSGKYRIKCITWPSIASCVLTFGDEAYGKRWRCWTARPTDEQRAATPWSEPPKEE